MFSIDHQCEFGDKDKSYHTVTYADIPFSDFAENFASIADFERLPVIVSLRQASIG